MQPELSVSEVCIAVGDPRVQTTDMGSCRADRCTTGVGGMKSSTSVDGSDSRYDLSSETIQNTRINENMTPQRELRRGSLKSGIRKTSSPGKRVNFIDESHSIHVLAGHKATLHNPNTSEEAKDRAREILSFHGEL